MSLIRLSQAQINADYGGKINALIELHQSGATVPEGIIVATKLLGNYYQEILPEIHQFQTIEEISLSYEEVLVRLQSAELPLEIRQALGCLINSQQTYIVRSSSLMEDHMEMSFAGQFDSILDCRGIDDISAAIKQCIASIFRQETLAYAHQNKLPFEKLRMAVLVQEQLEPDVSGVVFSLDPLSNHDQRIYLEYVAGHGAGLMDGKLEPYRLSLNWHGPRDTEELPINLLSQSQLDSLRQTVLQTVKYFGYPLDIEFCFIQDNLYLVQARPITRISSKVDYSSWTTANFRDGGVAAQACPQLMWSLYRDAWQVALADFLKTHRLIKTDLIGPLALIKYARPYWNIGVVKEAMVQIPGYIEREFDDELGVKKNYQGDGVRSQLTPRSLVHVAQVGVRLNLTTRSHQAKAEQTKQYLLEQYELLSRQIEGLKEQESLEETAALWDYVIQNAYMESETNYFKQVFINTVQLSMKKTALLRLLPVETFFQLIAKLGNVSHLQLLKAVVRVVGTLREQTVIYQQWAESSASEMLAILQQEASRLDAKAVAKLQQEYGYHSNRELTLLQPSYSEDLQSVIDLIQKVIHQPEYERVIGSGVSESLSEMEIEALIKGKVPKRQVKKVKQDVLFLRELLWWREEFKDISTRYYHLIRQVTLQLGECYQEKEIIKEADDLFYLEKEVIKDFIAGNLTQTELQTRIKQNRTYCQAYRNFQPAGELYERPLEIKQTLEVSTTTLKGIGANTGIVTGRVRVLEEMNEMNQIQSGEILVTRFTDTGWSYVFGIIGGLITETGGVLSHATIVAREFDIPAIVCAHGATQHLTTGMTVTLNGHTGEISIQDKKGE